ncbi:MAG TPA: hypothetical protein LFW11_01515 [Rickettsia endosymbiont of Proechinophthirus fluctus]|uniref:hypothetical protein n=1 Tax=Rickettsia endosymbiont of Proechinophthirus fluctus TaxID=1462733 RepID=UPI000789EA0A|nr:hypothetical protein [Rickettsia endosymbiont of Proechinophthirus fluctus]KYP98427.1 hypothetical protein BG75_05850 [Rickettsia endosymbiont of Proechinophthirus fluctus]HJD54056.1 hypothetical protein [Rickettsia endosymbiont of Proechinophthirus fluctus]
MKPQDLFLTGSYLIKLDVLNNLKKHQAALSLLEEVYDMNKSSKKRGKSSIWTNFYPKIKSKTRFR